MAAISTKPQTLSYAERAKRAGADSAAASGAGPSSSRSPAVNGTAKTSVVAAAASGGTGSNSPETPSSINVTPSSSVILTRPVSPTHQTSPEAAGDSSSSYQQQSSSALTTATPATKTALRSPPPNVWAARKEQMAQRVAVSQPSTSTTSPSLLPSTHTENTAPLSASQSSSTTSPGPSSKKNANSASRPPLNGINGNSTHVSPPIPPVSKERVDPFMAKTPVKQKADGLASGPAPPSLDDAESWPEMGKVGKSTPPASTSSPSTNTVDEMDRKDGITNTPKKSEKTKWVPIPATELQATADAMNRSGTHSRSQSQHNHHQQQNNQYRKSNSRQQSQARNGTRQMGSANGNNRNAEAGQGQQQQRDAVKNQPHSREGSNTQSRNESAVQSRIGSAHSSPRYPPRGRRLPDENTGAVTGVGAYTNSQGGSGPNTVGGRPKPNNDARAEAPQPRGRVNAQVQTQTQSRTLDNAAQQRVPYQPPAQLQQQAPRTPGSNSPIYYTPPPVAPYGGSPMSNMYTSLPANGMYPPPPINTQRPDGQPQQQTYSPYSPYSASQHLPAPQQPYPPYMYTQYPYGFYMPSGQGQERQLPVQSPYEQFGPTQSYFNVEQILRSKADNGEVGRSVMNGEDPRSEISSELPPATQVSHPPPPQESNAVAGYRDVRSVSVDALIDISSKPAMLIENIVKEEVGTTRESDQQKNELNASKNSKELDMVFGSVGRPGGLKSPSPDLSPPILPVVNGQNLSSSLALGLDIGEENELSPERSGRPAFTAFSIGMKPGEAGPSTMRQRARKKIRGGATDRPRTETAPGRVESTRQHQEPNDVALVEEKREKTEAEVGTTEPRVIDLTDPETKWQFGSNSKAGSEQTPNEYEKVNEVPAPSVSYGGGDIISQLPPDMQQSVQQQQPMVSGYGPAAIPIPPQSMGYRPTLPVIGTSLPMPMQSPSPQSQQMPPQLHSMGLGPVGPQMMSPLSVGPQMAGPNSALGGEEWEVRDFGYGFGPMSGTGYIPERIREERMERDRERERDKDFYGGRNRRGSNAGYGGYGYEGRGNDRGYGGGRRGRGMNGFNRGYGRGGFVERGRGRGGGHQHQPPFTVNQQIVPQHLPHQPQNLLNDGTYYYPASQVQTYIQPQYDAYSQALPLQPNQQQYPAPKPVTQLTFPLDQLRFYLLGQVEYYFSVQNLASDLYLRQQMDSLGWIYIPIIASFNRVKQLTLDVQLVKDVLSLSTIVEVRGDYVRMRDDQWRSFVLPGATPSGFVDRLAQSHSTDDTEDIEEEEDDDVVIVLGKDENRSWTTEQRLRERTENSSTV